MAKKKVKSTKDKVTKNKNTMKSKTQKPPKPKKAGVKDLHPKASNKDSLTDNVKSLSGQAIEDSGLGKIQRVALSQKLSVDPSRKKK